MRFYIDDFGPKEFTFTDEDDDILDLTGRTAEWHLRNRDGTIPAATPISGAINADPTTGKAVFTMAAALTAAKTKYSSVFKILESGTLIFSSVDPIGIEIDSIEGS